MATDIDYIPWPNQEGRLLRTDAVSLAEKAKTLAGERQLSRSVVKMRFEGRTTVAETDFLELARFLVSLGVDLETAGVPGSSLTPRSPMLSELRPDPIPAAPAAPPTPTISHVLSPATQAPALRPVLRPFSGE